ncbi:MAG TPA: OmpA family protein [Polyangiaceae bacterium]|nr:OmpA family protein [Polyangiaceae bacterium]
MPRILSKNSHWLLTALCTCFAASTLSGCHFEARVSSGSDAKKPAKEAEAKKPAAQDSKPAGAKQDSEKKPAKKPATPEAKQEEKKAPPKAEKPAPAEVNKDAVVLPGNLVFDAGKSTLKAGSGSDEILESLKVFLDQQPRVTLLRIEGHSDNTESPTDTLKLSGDRALTVKQWLVAKGVAESRLLAVGFGASKPIADNGSDEGRAQNRRVEFKIAQTGGKNYLGADPLGGGTEFK